VTTLFLLAVTSAAWAAGCHGDGQGSGCPMQGCPGSGLQMQSLSGAIAGIAQTHDAIRVKIAGSTTKVRLQVHPDCSERNKLLQQIGGLKMGQSIKCTFYKQDGKAYLCAIGGSGSCH
jgi:hypothetical protein